jgi:hypothetical protein
VGPVSEVIQSQAKPNALIEHRGGYSRDGFGHGALVRRCELTEHLRMSRSGLTTSLFALVGCSAASASGGAELVPVEFELGGSGFKRGDAIRIAKVFGDRPILEVGGHYRVEGEYELASADQASLAAYLTGGKIARGRENRTLVDRGRGRFSLRFVVEKVGQPHVSFYPDPSGSVIGGIYFGKGDCLLRRAEWLERLAE